MAFDVKIGNRTYELARARDVLRAPWDVEGARRQLERIEGWTEATARAVLESVDRMPLLRRADDDLTELVARLWVEGVLAVVVTRAPARPVDAPTVRDLVEPHHLGDLGQPTDPAAPPRERPAALTWVSFEIVDERGQPADGEFRCQLDAKLDAGGLEQRAHRYDELPVGTSSQLYAERLRWPSSTVDEPGITVADDAPPESPPAGDDRPVTTFEVLDSDGEALPGVAQWLDGSGARQEAKLGRVTEIVGTEPVTLEVAIGGRR